MATQTRAKRLIKLLERLLKQDHLYSEGKLREIKEQLRVLKEEVLLAEKNNSKGFGK
tara:strand:- start:9 stop:179 length:171 start_codon:yes stop_codon:yes gene_type:complete